MNGKHWAVCLGAVGLAGLALLAGLPAFYLLVLACPLMMLAMMAMMPGMHGGRDSQRQSGPYPGSWTRGVITQRLAA